MLRRNPNASLKDKLKEHYQTRSFTPTPASTSKAGLSATASIIFSLFLESVSLLIPSFYTAYDENGEWRARYGYLGETYWMMVVVVVLTWVEVTWNWWRVYYDVPNWVTQEMKTAQFGDTLETPPGE